MKKILILLVMMFVLIGCETEEQDNTKNSSNNSVVEALENDDEVNDETNVELESVESVTVGIETLNVRKGASLKTDVINQVHKGATYEILDRFVDENDESWYQIEVDGELGWIVMRYTYSSHLSVNDIVKLYDSPFDDGELYAVLEEPDMSLKVTKIISIVDDKPVAWFQRYYREEYYYFPIELTELETIKCFDYMNFVVGQKLVRFETDKQYKFITPKTYDQENQLLTIRVGTSESNSPYTLNMETGETTYQYVSYDNQTFGTRIKVLPDILNFREKPSTSSKKLGRLYKDSIYDVLATKTLDDGTWYQLQSGNVIGWVSGEFCEETSSDEVEYINAPLVLLYETYEEGDSLLPSHFEYEGDILGFSSNDHVMESYHFNNPGTHVVDVITEDVLGRQKVYRTEITVSKYYLGSDPIKAYESWSKKSEVLFDIHEEDMDFDWTAHFDYQDGKTVLWYQSTKDGQDFYISEPGLILPCSKMIMYLTNGRSKVYEGDFLYPDPLQLKHGYYAINQYFKSEFKVQNNKQTRLVSQTTGEARLIKSNFSHFSDPSSYFLYDSFSVEEYRNQPFTTIEVVDIQNGQLETVFTIDESYQGINLYHFVNPPEYRYTGYTFSDNDWDFADATTMETEGRIYYESDEWHYVITSDDTKHKSPITSFDLYEDMKANNIIGHYDVAEAEVIEFNRVFDIQNRTLVMWFEVEMKDGITGYTFRPRHEYEYEYIYVLEPFYLMTDDGPVTIDESKIYHRKKYMPSSFAASNRYILSDFDYGSTYTVIDYDGVKSEIALSLNYMLSPTGQLIVNNKGSNTQPVIEIISNDETGLKQVFEMELGQVSVGLFDWKNDAEVHFTITEYSTNFSIEHDGRIYLENDIWIFESDYQLQ